MFDNQNLVSHGRFSSFLVLPEVNLKKVKGVSKIMHDSEMILSGAYRDCLLLTMILGTLI